MQKITFEQQSAVINILKFYLIVIIVFIHTSRGEGPLADIMKEFLVYFSRIVVAPFFLISGYFFFSKMWQWDWNLWGAKLKKRVRILLIPYFLWNLIYLMPWCIMDVISYRNIESVFTFFQGWGGFNVFWGSMKASSPSILGYEVPFDKPVNYPLWYMRDLMVAMICAPIIFVFIKNCKKWGLLLLFVLFVFNIGLPINGFALLCIFFFSLGGYFMLNKKLFLEQFYSIRRLGYFFTVLLLVASICIEHFWPEYYPYLTNVWTPFAVISFFNLTNFLFCKGWIKEHKILVDSSFFLYAVHATVLSNIVMRLIYTIMPLKAIGGGSIDHDISTSHNHFSRSGIIFVYEKDYS